MGYPSQTRIRYILADVSLLMLFVCVYVVPVPTAPPPAPKTSCPKYGKLDPWKQYGKSCFLFVPDDIVDWDVAVLRCKLFANNSRLASVRDIDENRFIALAMHQEAVNPTALSSYIGLYNTADG